MTQPTDNTEKERQKHVLDWDKAYIGAMIDELKPNGDVLEIGFGNGEAAEHIQSLPIKSHTIIESNPDLLKKAIEWQKKYPKVKIIENTWEVALPKLGQFNTIFFNNHFLTNQDDVLNYLFSNEIATASNTAKELMNEIEKRMSEVTAQYSDKEIEAFYQKVGQFNKHEMPAFFHKLMDNGNISEEQYKSILKKHSLNPESGKNKVSTKRKVANEMFTCLQECLKNHMQKGSRFSAYLYDHTSKYSDTRFFDQVITDPNLDYAEKTVAIKIDNKPHDALVFVIEMG